MIEVSDKIYDKLAKMIRHERSARSIGNLAEAEAFATKVQELLSAHKLEMSEIELEEHDREPIGEERPDVKVIQRRVDWQTHLARAIAYANGCEVLSYIYHSAIIFIGRSSDRKACLELFKYFVELAKQLAKRSADENREKQRHLARIHPFYDAEGPGFYRTMSHYKESFCIGFARALANRILDAANKAKEAKQQAEGENSTALVHLARDEKAVQDYVQNFLAQIPRIKGSRQRKQPLRPQFAKSEEGYYAGQDAGESVALTSKTIGCRALKTARLIPQTH